MGVEATALTPALSTYDRLAPFYDSFTADYDHDTWLARLEATAREHGLSGRRVLDVACGTGKSFAPLAARGYEVTACDISPGMVGLARQQGVDPSRVFVADMRALPECGRFDLVTCLDDAINYVLEPAGLAATFASISRALAPGGVLVFDTNTLLTYRTAFAETFTLRRAGLTFRWTGEASSGTGPAEAATASLDVTWRGGTVHARHVQRHHPAQQLSELLDASGLRLEAVVGQTTGCVLHRHADELRHTKAVFIARKPPDEGEEW
jgi:SAM-dependent methyltransferase